MKGGKKLVRTVLKVISCVLSLALLVLAGASLVLANPQPDQVTQPPAPQPALTPYPDVNASTERDLRSLIASFPAPVMSFISGSGMTFVSGSSRNVEAFTSG